MVHAVHRVENEELQDVYNKHNSSSADEVRVAAAFPIVLRCADISFCKTSGCVISRWWLLTN
jgi:hypothetical protein